MTTKTKILLFVVNTPWFFLSHRLPLAVAAKKAGFDVHVATADGPQVSRINSEGFVHHVVPFNRSKQNLSSNLASFLSLLKIFKRLQPDLLHLVTIKPVIFGGIAARMAGIKSVIAAISGLGTVFIDNSYLGCLRRAIVMKLYRSAFKHHRLKVIFQNTEDSKYFLDNNLLCSQDIKIIRGSGVNLTEYPFLAEPNSLTTVVMASRLLWDKGVKEFIDAAKILKSQEDKIIFRLIGDSDLDNKTSIPKEFINKWKEEGIVEFLGFREDIASQYANAHIICLPSYREGLPKCLIEAAACGRSVVTTDVPGCRDAITPGLTGLLCSVKDSNSLANAIKELADDPIKRQQMGKAGRHLAETEFAIEIIIEQHMEIYKQLVMEE
jgi:glycosyltransferase involved in cell wall biosynthesis